MDGSTEFKILKDKWTAVSVDNKRYLCLYNHSSVKVGKNVNKMFTYMEHIKCLNIQFLFPFYEMSRLFQNWGNIFNI